MRDEIIHSLSDLNHMRLTKYNRFRKKRDSFLLIIAVFSTDTMICISAHANQHAKITKDVEESLLSVGEKRRIFTSTSVNNSQWR